jgi:hypothetical protein
MSRWYTVTFGDAWGRGTWMSDPAAVGTTGFYVITNVLDRTRRIMVEPEPSGLQRG